MLTTRFAWTLWLSLAVLAVASVCERPAAIAQDENDATAILERSAETMLDLESFHFVITTPVGKTLLTDGVELNRVEGDVVRPMAFQATFSVDLGIASFDLQAIGIDTTLWVANPLEGGAFTRLTGGADQPVPPLALLNPDQLIMQAVNLIQEPVVEGSEEIEGLETTLISGTFDPSDITIAGTPVVESFTGDIDPLTVMLWIDGDSRVVRAEFSGALLPSEQGGGRIIRRVDLSRFDEPLTIEPPETGAAD